MCFELLYFIKVTDFRGFLRMIFADYLIEPLRAEKNVFFLGSVVNRDFVFHCQEKLLLE